MIGGTMNIVVAGMMGAGKTTYTNQLAKWYQLEPLWEAVKENWLLEKFYHEPKEWGFQLQLFFLNDRFEGMKRALQEGDFILDRSIYEDEVYAATFQKMEYMKDVEYQLYQDILQKFIHFLEQEAEEEPIDYLIYLEGSFETILERIKERNRDYEQLEEGCHRYEYYKTLYDAYCAWYEQYQGPKLKIDIDEWKIIEEPEKVQAFIEKEIPQLKEYRK